MAGISYKDAGVDIDAGDELVKRIKPAVKKTFGPEVATDLGLFGGAFKLDLTGYEEPILISSVDGVGTKTVVAEWASCHNTVGRDLVNHCVDDIFTCGAKPLFFMDYYATSRLNVDVATQVIQGLAAGCQDLGVALLGGETAEMPSVYHEGVYDLAGTIVGIVDRKKLINGENINEGDLLFGLESTGLHTNGYSLARKVFLDTCAYQPDKILEGMDVSVSQALLAVHRCYYPLVKPWLDAGLEVKGMAHITGGGIEGNTSRIIPKGLKINLDWNGWEWPPLFKHIQKSGEISDEEMRRAFNLGIGWILVISPKQEAELLKLAEKSGENTYRLGYVEKA